MDILKVIGVGIIGVLIASLIKRDKEDYFSVFVVLVAGIIILIYIVHSLGDVVVAFNKITDTSGIDDKLFGTILKIIGIGYLTEYSASICTDFHYNSLGAKIQLAGKIAIFLMALPIITNLIELIGRIAG
ncbi:MAG: stage III sporulation protein AD [Christensenellales bacterium]|jgi:stage III sporulation protein AD